ncbi:unnamed protein product [Allacma fusca]|uniref:Periplasmic heavy metal sensor n=1 Tax=Allacma fusca TaxID=39272 RepID=A0A8J2P4D3_9HEXA|nr:unnamed protein product [Allacma fusca]
MKNSRINIYFGILVALLIFLEGTEARSRKKKQASPSGTSLDTILNEAKVNPASRQSLLANLTPAQRQQLTTDLTALRTELQKNELANLRQFTLKTVATTMSPEVALDLLSRLNSRFRQHAWWQRINMISINKIFEAKRG